MTCVFKTRTARRFELESFLIEPALHIGELICDREIADPFDFDSVWHRIILDRGVTSRIATRRDGCNGRLVVLGSRTQGADAAVREIARVLRKHVDRNTFGKIIEELLRPGVDKVFRETIQVLAFDLGVHL